MATSSQRKGSRFELELAAHINTQTGLRTAHRAPLSGGGRVGLSGGADILGVPGLFIEAKRTERLNVRKALEQVELNVAKTHSPDLAIVVTRQNRMPTPDSLVVLRLRDFLVLYRRFLESEGYV